MRTILLAGLGVAALMTLGASPATARKSCGADGHWCSSQCGAWNNWCRPACGEWNGWCAGRSLPNTFSGMQKRSYFADPRWVGQSFANPQAFEWDEPAEQPKARRKAWRRD